MTSFSANQLILLFLALCQLSQPISSTTLTLKSSHSHLNLNRILNSNFDRSEVRLSLKYKPLNQRFSFTLISGILDLQAANSESVEPLKFVLVVNPDERLELIVNQAKEVSRENRVSSYFVLEVNQSKVFPREKIDLFRYGLDEPVRSDGQHFDQEQKSHLDEKKNNWRLLGLLISRDQLKIAHTAYASCLSNSRKQSNCRQSSLVYRLTDRWPAEELVNSRTFQQRVENEQNAEPTRAATKDSRPKFIELNQLLVGKEWSESDSYLINLADRSVESPNQSELKQLNETEDQHSKSQIHNNFLQNPAANFQSSNQEQFSGLIGCLSAIELNGHHLEFSLANQINESNAANEPNRTDSVETADQVVKKQIKKQAKRSMVNVSGKTVEKELENNLSGVKDDRTVWLNAEDFRIAQNVSLFSDQIEIEERPVDDWWRAQRWDNLLVGRIELNRCNQSDPCANYCLHNAACMLNEEDGQPICHCDLVGYTGERCFFRKFLFFFQSPDSFPGFVKFVFTSSSFHHFSVKAIPKPFHKTANTLARLAIS